MPAYTFEALDTQGNNRKGVIEGESARAVRGLLRTQSLVPLSVEPVVGDASGSASSGGLNRTIFAKRVFNATGLSIWTRQIAGLVTSGLPLERALTALTDEAEDERQRN